MLGLTTGIGKPMAIHAQEHIAPATPFSVVSQHLALLMGQTEQLPSRPAAHPTRPLTRFPPEVYTATSRVRELRSDCPSNLNWLTNRYKVLASSASEPLAEVVSSTIAAFCCVIWSI